MKKFIPCRNLFWGMLLIFLLLTPPLTGEEIDFCDRLKTSNDLFHCILQNAPSQQRAKIEIEQRLASEKSAGQRPNPEIETRLLFGVGGNEKPVLSEVNFYHPWELGGKRKDRIQKATEEKGVTIAEKNENLEDIALRAVFALYRLRQIDEELTMLAENLSTYRKVVSLFKKRPLLSPEQETSLLVFQLAMDEGLLKKTSLKNEERLLKTEIYQWVGYDLSLPRSLLPRTPQSWPNLLVESSPSIDQWSRVKTAEAKLRSAQAITQVVHSEGWPTLKIGPSVETESPLTGTRTAVGFALSTSLPFYQRNEGKKAEAIQGEKLAELKLKIIKKGGELEREKLVSDYQHNLKAYLAAKPQLIREQKHQEIESLFERGLIPSSLMLETHRQMFEFQQELHQAELKAIESLWKIYALEGRLLEESL